LLGYRALTVFNNRMEDIYQAEKRLERLKEVLKEKKNGDIALEFLEHLRAKGLSTIRLVKYASTLRKILDALDIRNASKEDVKKFISEINSSGYKAWTRQGFYVVTKKLFQWLEYSDTSKDTPYPERVSWIKTGVSEKEVEKQSRISPDKLLSPDDVKKLIDAATNPRDRAMISVLFEGAFRPAELLNMTISSVSFEKDYCIINTKGKTGIKRIPLVVSYQPLLQWLNIHPFRSNPEAPLWCALDTNHRGHRLSYSHFQKIIKKTAKKAELNKEIWAYLFRHSQLTALADKLTDSKLSLFAGWTLGTKMVKRYVHWSGRELDNTILSLHGLVDPVKSNSVMTLKICPRCQKANSPSDPRCVQCGLILDRELAMKYEDDLETRLRRVEEMLQKLLKT
jgi:integrase/recombinase XerD